MPCFSPLQGWRRKSGGVTFSLQDAYVDVPMSVACGQCIGCRLERSRQWAVRIMHEASLHPVNSFVTLTYDDDHLPPNGSLQVEDFQKFMKRLRKARSPMKVRFYHAGEYGENLGRPHYHACLFNCDFPDRAEHRVRGSNKVWRSAELEELWPAGISELGSITFESAAYVARYCTKKVNGGAAADHYNGKRPEYATMSRRPGIGQGWLEKYGEEVYPSDEVIMRGQQQLPPRYYDTQLKKENPELHQEVTFRRRIGRDYENNTYDRLLVREEVTKARLSTFQARKLEQ